ncbi:MAG: GDP-mannose 4,6-dehydratase [Anaerolineaceae bacterium]|nr:GDP-mannose 4,6-dehydratase [Anaerolineaceae bacterium]
MRILITGVNGFVGRHLATHLQRERPQQRLFGTALEGDWAPGIAGRQLDLCDEASTRQLIDEIKPNVIYHLAAQAFVPRSFEYPWETLENNIRAQLNILEACLSAGIQPRIVIVSSGEIYGAVSPSELPIAETAALRPNSPYSVSKVTQDLLAYQYFVASGLPILRARPFNHFGPGQNTRFMAADFARQVVRMECGAAPILQVGNLETRRDFTDVRDIVRAYVCLAEQGEAGEAYNIASGVSHSGGNVVRVLQELTAVRFRVAVQRERFRPSDAPAILGDASRLRSTTGWEPQIPFRQSLCDILQQFREEMAQDPASV